MKREIMRQSLQAALRTPPATQLHIYSARGLESVTDTLVGSLGVVSSRISLETQQMQSDAAAQVADAIEQQTSVDVKPTVPAVFVASSSGVASGRVEDQEILREAVRHRLEHGSDVAVALLPVETGSEDEAGDPLHADLIEAARQFVADVEIPVLESLDAVGIWLSQVRASSDA